MNRCGVLLCVLLLALTGCSGGDDGESLAATDP